METTLMLNVSGMHCEACVQNIEAALAALPGVRNHAVELGKVQVRFSEAVTSKAEVLRAIRGAGPYELTSFSTART